MYLMLISVAQTKVYVFNWKCIFHYEFMCVYGGSVVFKERYKNSSVGGISPEISENIGPSF